MDPQAIPAFWYYMIAVQVVGVFTTIIGYMWTWMRENRLRQWDLEDRMKARIETHSLIQEAKNDAHAAFTEANHAKQLISSIEEVRNNIQHKTLEVINGVKEATQDANVVLNDIQSNTAETVVAVKDLTSQPIRTVPTERRKK